MENKKVLLKVENLTTSFNIEGVKATAVNAVSFDVYEGETFGLVGESGSGKSITCRSLMGLVHVPGRITGGKVIYKGKDVVKATPAEFARIRGKEMSMIFQEPMTALNPVLKIGEQLVETFKNMGLTSKERWERSIEMLQKVGIPSPELRINDYPHQFSGGMRQRAMIAIALASQPKLLLADEPTTALDVTIQAQIIDLLEQLKNDMGMSMILVTHNLGVASQICNRIAVMYGGNIMELAHTRDLFKSPANPYTKGLLASLPVRKKKGEKLYAIPGIPPSLLNMPEGCPFAPRCDSAMNICTKVLPPLYPVGEDHHSRCHLHVCGKGGTENAQY